MTELDLTTLSNYDTITTQPLNTGYTMYTYTITYFELTNALDPEYVNKPLEDRLAKAYLELGKAARADIVEFDLNTAIFIISQYYRVDRDLFPTDKN